MNKTIKNRVNKKGPKTKQEYDDLRIAQKYPKSFIVFVKKWFEIILKSGPFDNYKISKFYFKAEDEGNPYCDKLTGMEIVINDAYLELEINIFPAAYRTYQRYGSRYFVERYMPHELVHSVVWPLTSLAMERCITWEQLGKEDERLTEFIARLLVEKYNNSHLFDELGVSGWNQIKTEDDID